MLANPEACPGDPNYYSSEPAASLKSRGGAYARSGYNETYNARAGYGTSSGGYWSGPRRDRSIAETLANPGACPGDPNYYSREPRSSEPAGDSWEKFPSDHHCSSH